MDYSKLKVVELKEELKSRGLSTAGLKKDLVQRLTDADAASATEENESTERQVEATEQAEETAPAAESGGVQSETPVPESPKVEAPVQVAISETGTTVIEAAEADKVQALEPKAASEESGAVENAPVLTVDIDKSAPADEFPEWSPSAEIKQHSEELNSVEAEKPVATTKRKASPEDEAEDVSVKRIKNESRSYNELIAEKEPEEGENSVAVEAEAIGAAEPVKEETKDDENSVAVDRNPNTPREKYRPTKSVYIQNFSRPLNIPSLKSHLESLAGSRLVKFWIDSIRTHCYTIFESVEAASKVREEVYGQTFPLEEKGRKKLATEYIPDSKVDEWIEFEESDQGRLRKWEVSFGDGLSNGVDADAIKLVEAGTKPKNNGASFRERLNPRHSPWVDTTRSMGIADSSTVNMANVKVKSLDELFKKTNAKPSLYYCEAPEDVVRQRLEGRKKVDAR
ncbi:hypothetical protein POJ06DRAFT_196486 [Lipomyces tetrasporus]|uniref:SAP domain-containing protein n=1 Tax=Lipomyces tetrasporus TaxID=54092 RepID=A0AAD7QRQ4_9ASCO|nr:uncharacterized protein POJ06DRAFT_196486 [Lipomyces tetrasporus]KAJ8100309.1 hypothetical protein POJ06DRAFT_196486 [Lipomyces tetrasporus]